MVEVELGAEMMKKVDGIVKAYSNQNVTREVVLAVLQKVLQQPFFKNALNEAKDEKERNQVLQQALRNAHMNISYTLIKQGKPALSLGADVSAVEVEADVTILSFPIVRNEDRNGRKQVSVSTWVAVKKKEDGDDAKPRVARLFFPRIVIEPNDIESLKKAEERINQLNEELDIGNVYEGMNLIEKAEGAYYTIKPERGEGGELKHFNLPKKSMNVIERQGMAGLINMIRSSTIKKVTLPSLFADEIEGDDGGEESTTDARKRRTLFMTDVMITKKRDGVSDSGYRWFFLIVTDPDLQSEYADGLKPTDSIAMSVDEQTYENFKEGDFVTVVGTSQMRFNNYVNAKVPLINASIVLPTVDGTDEVGISLELADEIAAMLEGQIPPQRPSQEEVTPPDPAPTPDQSPPVSKKKVKRTAKLDDDFAAFEKELEGL